MTELPDAPWATGREDLPEAPWIAPAPPSPVLSSGLIGSALDLPILGPVARKAEAATKATFGPTEDVPEPTFGERYNHWLRLLEQPLEQYRSEHPVAAALANLGGTAVAAGGLGATAAGARLLGAAPAGTGLVGQAVRGAVSGAGLSAADAQSRGEDPAQAAMAGAGLGAAGAGAARAIEAMMPAAKAIVPTVAELKASARAGYQHPEVAAIEIKPQAVSNLSAQIQNDLIRGQGAGFRPNTTPKTFGIVDELSVPLGVSSVNMGDIQNIRQALGNVAKEVDAVGRPTPESAASARAMKGLDGFLDNLRQPDLLAGDAAKAVPILRAAGKDWGAAMRAEDLGVRLTRAERQAAKSGSGTNIQNAIKQKVSAVLDVPQRSAGYSAAEKAAAEAVVRGSLTEDTLRKLGKLGFGDGLSLLLHGGAVLGGAAPVSIPVGIGGLTARKAAEAMTRSKANLLDEMLRSRSPLYQQRAAAIPASGAAPMNPFIRAAVAAPSYGGGLYFPSGP